MKKNYILLFATGFLLLLFGCQLLYKKVSKTEVSGTYVANYTGMVDSLILKENGVFEHYFYDSSGYLYTDSGKWVPYEHGSKVDLSSFNKIQLHGICRRYDSWDRRITIDNSDCGTTGTSIYKLGDKVRIVIDPDAPLYYEKIE